MPSPACSTARKLSSRTGAPRASRPGMSRPDRYMPRVAAGANQSASVISVPRAVHHARSRSPSAECARPEKNARRRSTGCRCRSSIRRAVSARSPRQPGSSRSLQSTQLISLSWQYALLEPPCVRPISSPATSIGTPVESSSVVMRFLSWRRRSAAMSASSVSPSVPQFRGGGCSSGAVREFAPRPFARGRDACRPRTGKGVKPGERLRVEVPGGRWSPCGCSVRRTLRSSRCRAGSPTTA
ncbi:hypothetical protein SALBM135S_06170 [Streptomyces alboniger]